MEKSLEKINKRCSYRNEIVHGMFNKVFESLREMYLEHVLDFFDTDSTENDVDEEDEEQEENYFRP